MTKQPLPDGRKIEKFKHNVRICTAYILTHVKSGCFYVGSSGDAYRRKLSHLETLRKNIHHNVKLQQLYNDDADVTFTFYLTDTREEAYGYEQQLLDENKDNPKLLNIAKDVKAAWFGRSMDSATREKISVGHRGKTKSTETRERMRLSKLGKSQSLETRRKISLTLKGRPLSEERVKKMAIDRKGYANKGARAAMKKVSIGGKVYQSLSDAARELGTYHSTISRRFNKPKYKDWFEIES